MTHYDYIIADVRLRSECDFAALGLRGFAPFATEVEGDADSLAGLLLELKGDFPELHENIDFHHLTFEVMEMDERRIVKIKVVVHNTSKSDADA